jgi:hypothetical protein
MQPTNFTISYYEGDDFTLTIYPKDSTGAAIPLVPGTDTVFFKIANERGPSPANPVTGTTCQIVDPNGGTNYAIVASVSSAIGVYIENGYVYDIGYVKDGKRVTVLTGNFSVVDRVYPL